MFPTIMWIADLPTFPILAENFRFFFIIYDFPPLSIIFWKKLDYWQMYMYMPSCSPPFISDAKDKHPTFIFSVIRSRMFPPFISDAKDKHPTFIF